MFTHQQKASVVLSQEIPSGLKMGQLFWICNIWNLHAVCFVILVCQLYKRHSVLRTKHLCSIYYCSWWSMQAALSREVCHREDVWGQTRGSKGKLEMIVNWTLAESGKVTQVDLLTFVSVDFVPREKADGAQWNTWEGQRWLPGEISRSGGSAEEGWRSGEASYKMGLGFGGRCDGNYFSLLTEWFFLVFFFPHLRQKLWMKSYIRTLQWTRRLLRWRQNWLSFPRSPRCSPKPSEACSLTSGRQWLLHGRVALAERSGKRQGRCTTKKHLDWQKVTFIYCNILNVCFF